MYELGYDEKSIVLLTAKGSFLEHHKLWRAFEFCKTSFSSLVLFGREHTSYLLKDLAMALRSQAYRSVFPCLFLSMRVLSKRM